MVTIIEETSPTLVHLPYTVQLDLMRPHHRTDNTCLAHANLDHLCDVAPHIPHAPNSSRATKIIASITTQVRTNVTDGITQVQQSDCSVLLQARPALGVRISGLLQGLCPHLQGTFSLMMMWWRWRGLRRGTAATNGVDLAPSGALALVPDRLPFTHVLHPRAFSALGGASHLPDIALGMCFAQTLAICSSADRRVGLCIAEGLQRERRLFALANWVRATARVAAGLIPCRCEPRGERCPCSSARKAQ